MNELLVDAGPCSQARAITTYCLIVEGVLADTGQRVLGHWKRGASCRGCATGFG